MLKSGRAAKKHPGFATHSGVKPTCQESPTDAIDPTATSAKRQKLLVKQLTALPKVLL